MPIPYNLPLYYFIEFIIVAMMPLIEIGVIAVNQAQRAMSLCGTIT